MKPALKPIRDQVIIITEASSGIGLITARLAAKLGARVVAAGRHEELLNELTEEINAQGGEAIYVKCDISREEDVARIANTAIRAYGTFDTWINNAGIFADGSCLTIGIEDLQKMVDTNFWGVVYGCRIAANHFKIRGEAGVIVNVGNFSDDKSAITQAAYSLSKSTVTSFTDMIRIELEKENAPVSISLIHSSEEEFSETKNTTKVQAKKIELGYSSKDVAEAILQCAERPKRNVYVVQHKLRAVPSIIEASFIKVRNQSNIMLKKAATKMRIKSAYENEKTYDTKTSRRPFISTLLAAGLSAGIWLLIKRKPKSFNKV